MIDRNDSRVIKLVAEYLVVRTRQCESTCAKKEKQIAGI